MTEAYKFNSDQGDRPVPHRKKTIVIFDLDDTLIHEGFDEPILCDETLETLRWLQEQDALIAVATHNDDAMAIIKELKIDHFFTGGVAAYTDDSYKLSHVNLLLRELNRSRFIESQGKTDSFTFNDIIFVDDVDENVEKLRLHGVVAAIHVDWMRGIRCAAIQQAFNEVKE